MILAASVCTFSCGEPTLDLVGMMDGQSPDTDVRFGLSASAASGKKVIYSPTDAYKVYVGSDMHIDSKASTAHTDTFLERFAADDNAPMALILGDLVNGKTYTKSASDHVRQKAGDKSGSVFLALGNHDIYFGLWPEWKEEWGDATYTVEVKTPSCTDLYICLESASGYLGSKQIKWLKETLQKASGMHYRHILVYSHTHMFKPDGVQGHTSNFPIEETYELTGMFKEYGVEMYLSGHRHSRDRRDFMGVEYIVIDALEEHYEDNMAGYMVLTVEDELDCEFICLG